MVEPQQEFFKFDEADGWIRIGKYPVFLDACKAGEVRPDTILRRKAAKGRFEIKPAGRIVKWTCDTKEDGQSKIHLDFNELRQRQKEGLCNFCWANKSYSLTELEEIVKSVEEADRRVGELAKEPASLPLPLSAPSPLESSAAPDTSVFSAPVTTPPATRDAQDLSFLSSSAPKAIREKKSSPSLATPAVIAAVASVLCLVAVLGFQCWWCIIEFPKEVDDALAKLSAAAQASPVPATANSPANGPQSLNTPTDTLTKDDLVALNSQIDQSMTALRSQLDQSTASLKSQVGKSTAAVKPQIDELTTSLKSQIGELATSTATARGDDAKQRREQLVQVLKAMQSLTESLEKINGEGKQRWEQSVKDLKDLQSQIAEFRRDGRLMQGHLERLAAAVQVPPDERLASVLLMIDSGQRMSEYDYPAVRQAVFQVVEASLRQTPRRKIGVAANRGDRITVPLAPDVHFLVPDLDVFRKEFADHQAAAGEESVRLTGIQSALDLVVPRGDKWRLVYVTCTSLRHTEPEPEKWRRVAELSMKYAVQVWVIHLLKTGEEPSLELLNLATETGGQYVGLCVRSADATTDRKNSSTNTKETLPHGTAESVQQRLSQLLCQPLDLPPLGRSEP